MAEAGQGISVVPLRYVSAQNVFKLLDAFGVKASTLRPDNGRNTLIVTGSGSDRAAAIDTILSFDADWMRGQSVGIFPIVNGNPEPIVAELEKIMDTGDSGLGQNVIKFQTVSRMNAIMVISHKPGLLHTAETWIKRLDGANSLRNSVHVYHVKYGEARQMAKVLNDMFTGNSGNADTPSSDLGIHHFRNRSGWLHALNTMAGGASKTRVTTSSRSDLRSTFVRFCATA